MEKRDFTNTNGVKPIDKFDSKFGGLDKTELAVPIRKAPAEKDSDEKEEGRGGEEPAAKEPEQKEARRAWSVHLPQSEYDKLDEIRYRSKKTYQALFEEAAKYLYQKYVENRM